MRNSGKLLAKCVVSSSKNTVLTGKLLIFLSTSPITSTDPLGLPTSVPLTYAQRAPGSPVMSE